MTEAEARTLFRAYLAEDCEGSPLAPEDLGPQQLDREWRTWLRQTQIETGLAGPGAEAWRPT